MAVDIHVGARVRLRRRFLGVSQQALADALGITFQQVQKYERGANRISASKLYDIARTLGSTVSYFFEGLPDSAGSNDQHSHAQNLERTVLDFLLTDEGLELAEAFPRIGPARLRRRVLELIRTLAGAEDAND